MTYQDAAVRRGRRPLDRALTLICAAALLLTSSACTNGRAERLRQLVKALCALGIWCPPAPLGCKTCDPAYLHAGRCERLPLGNGDEEWVRDDNSLLCGATQFAEVGGELHSSCVRGKCTGTAAGPLALIGFEALPVDEIPASVVRAIPAAGEVLYDNQPVVIQFDETMNPTGVVLNGALGQEAAPAYAFSRTDRFNDTLTIQPAGRWTTGPRGLTVDLKDDTGNPSSVSISWHVLAEGAPATPDFAQCRPEQGTTCGERWFLPYVAQFAATGGVPPYTWQAGAGALPHDAEAFAVVGTFAGQRAECPPCLGPICIPLVLNCTQPVGFDVCVKDALGSQTCHPVRWEFGL